MHALRHSVTNTAESEADTFKRFHHQNAVVVKNVIVDAMKKRDEIIAVCSHILKYICLFFFHCYT
jgi:hypothetical protein